MAPTWPPELPRRLQDGPRTLQDASYTPPGTPQDLPRRLQDRPQRAQGAPKALQEPPRRLREPPRPLQERFWRPKAASKSSPEEALETPSRLQELSRGAVQASSCCPAPSSLWPAGTTSNTINIIAGIVLCLLTPNFW